MTGVQTCALPISYAINRYPVPASVIKDHIQKINAVEFKTDLIFVDIKEYDPEHKRMLQLLLSEMKFEKPISIVFSHEYGIPSREQYVNWLMNAKVVINPFIINHIGDEIYEYYAAKCIPLTNRPKFCVNIVKEEWRIEPNWFISINNFIDAMPIIKDKLTDAFVNYEANRPIIDFEERRLEKIYFDKNKFLAKIY